MFQQTNKNRVLFKRTFTSVVMGMFGIATILYGGFAFHTQRASAATNSTVNFQARLEGAGGNIAADGYYNIQFKLYSASTGGAALWTESYYDSNGVTAGNDNRVEVRNGYVSVKLGSQTAFPGTINWDQDLYLTMNVGGTTQTATPTYDGEMSPRLALTGVPYAFRAGQLATFNSGTGFTSTLSILQPTVGNQVFQISDQAAAGTYTLCVQGSTACGFAASSGSGNYIQNQSASAQASSNFWISGTGQAATLQGSTSVLTPLLDTASAVALNIGTTNATAINLNKNVVVAASQSLTLTGGNTASRPASPTEGMLYYDTTTKSLLVYANAKWQADRSSSTIVVGTSAAGGTSTAVASKAPDGADYINTSTTSAQTVINSAITALPAGGGHVYLMEGTYIIDGSISLPSNVTLTGSGPNTVIKLKNAINANIDGIVNSDTTNGNTRISINNLRIDGNKANNSSGTQKAISFTRVSSTSGASGAKLDGLWIEDTRNDAVSFLNTSNNSSVTNSFFTNLGTGSNGTGVNVSNTTGVKVANNTFINTAGTPIWFNTAANTNTATGNVITGSTAISIRINGNNNTVSGNSITGGGGVQGITISTGTGNVVTGNKLHDIGSTSAVSSIDLSSTSNNTIIGNNITDTAGTGFAILLASTAATTYLADNQYSGTGASSISDSSTTTIYANQIDGSGNLINRSQGGGLSVGKSSATTTLDVQGAIKTSQITTPAAPTLATVGTAGSTSRTYAVSALDGNGETLASTGATITTSNATLTGANYVTVTWVPIGGAVQYKVYRTASAGTPATTGLIGTVAGSVATLNDTGLAGSGSTPAANTTGGGSIAGALTLGIASTNNASIILNNSTNANSITIASGVTASSYQLTLPTGIATTGDCLKAGTVSGGNVPLTFSACGGGGGVTLQGSTPGTPDTGNINITGTGIFGTAVQAPLYDTASAVALNIGTTNATAINLNKNVVVAASQSLALTGGNTASRPASPTEGMLYYDTTTKSLLVYANAKWQADRSTATKIVAMGTATGCSGTVPVASSNADAADFVSTSCNAAETTIQAAITALPAGGGTVYIMEGTYILGASVNIPSNVTIAGSGSSTVLKFKNAANNSTGIFQNSDTTNGNEMITVRDILLDGNKANQASGAALGIKFTKVGGTTPAAGAHIRNIWVSNFTDVGIWVGASTRISIVGVTSQLNDNNGITLNGTTNSTITGSIASSNSSSNSAGISINGSSSDNTVSGNTIRSNGSHGINLANASNNTVSNNAIALNASNGITVGSSNTNVITGNTITTSTVNGIQVSSSSDNIISNNLILGSGAYGIRTITATNNSFTGNNVSNSGLITTTNSSISLTSSSANNVFANNKITDTAGTGYAIEIASTNPNNVLNNNVIGTGANGVWNGAGPISDAATGTVYINQTDNLGTLKNSGLKTSGLFQSADGTNNTDAALVAKVQGSATADLLQTQDSSGNVLLKVSSTGTLTIGRASNVTGTIVLQNSTNANTATLASGVTSTSYQLTLPTAAGTAGQCMAVSSVASGNVQLGYATCSGGSGTLQSAYTASTGGATAEIVLDTTRNGLTVRNAASDTITSNLLEIQNSAGTATFLGVSPSAFTLQDSAGNNALVLDSTTGVLKVFENVSSPTNFASISYSGGSAIFAASSGTTQIGSGTGSVTSNLTGQTDVFSFSKTYTAAAAYSSNDFLIQRAVTGGVNTLTGSVLKIEDVSSATTASNIQPSVLLVNQSNASATGFLFSAQSAGVSQVTIANSGAVNIVSSATAGSFVSNTYDGSGSLTVGSSTATAITIGRSAITTAILGTIRLGDASNNMTISTSGEPTLNGTGRHTRKIIMSAEYAGATMTADGTNNNGSMTSDNMTTTPFRNFYKWLNTQGTAQDYDIWVRIPLPSDFSAFPTSQTICVDTYASATTANGVSVTLYGTNNSAVTLSDGDLTPSSTNTWQNQCTSSITGGTYAANGYINFAIKLTAPATTGDIRIGDITFDYLSKW